MPETPAMARLGRSGIEIGPIKSGLRQMANWCLGPNLQQDAENHFEAAVDAALAGRPQTVSRGGKPAAVVAATEEYDRLLRAAKANRGSFVDHLLAFPADSIPRAAASPRGADLRFTYTTPA